MTGKKKGHTSSKEASTTPRDQGEEGASDQGGRHLVEYNLSSGRPRFSCSRCNDMIIRPPHLSGQEWDQAVEIFKRQHGILQNTPLDTEKERLKWSEI
ncbi:MAG: hypothetical protein WAO55_04575 [Candidatus Manganitrophaceae bacterium]